MLAAACAVLCAAGAPALCQTAPSLAPYFTPAASGTAGVDEDGFIRRWMLLEPIAKPNRTNQLFTSDYVRKAFSEDRPTCLGGKF
ncbi:MAG: hypothetical protein VW891_17625, partial [Novosphingobium sp.]